MWNTERDIISKPPEMSQLNLRLKWQAHQWMMNQLPDLFICKSFTEISKRGKYNAPTNISCWINAQVSFSEIVQLYLNKNKKQ